MNTQVWQPEFLTPYENDLAIIFMLDSRLLIRYCNAAWDRFARGNRGAHLVRNQPIGHSVLDVTPSDVRPFYENLYKRALLGEPVSHTYECSSDEKLRQFHMYIALKDVPDKGSLLVVTNSLVFEGEHDREVYPFDPLTLRDRNGLIAMCCNCRRTRMPDSANSWVWVPDLIRDMPAGVSHGICTVCLDLHYDMN